MELEEIKSKLENVFREVFAEPSLILDGALTANDVDGWDSLSHMLLISEVEKVFSIKFRLSDLNKMRNVGDMMNIIVTKL